MKKLVLLTILSVIVQISVIAQSCLPNGIHFKTQSEIDNFNTNYPNCTKIEGPIIIDDTIEGDITNLLGLSNLTQTGFYFRISNNSMLTELNGLENFDTIGYSLSIIDNNSLTSLSAFESLNYVYSYIEIVENPSLVNLEGLEQLDTITNLSIIENESLQDLSELSNLKKTRTLLHIENNQSLNSLSGLENLVFVGEDLKIFNNNSLTDLQGLNGLKYIQSGLKIRYNDQLTSLDGLENLDTINGGLSIWGNDVLSSLESINNCHLKFALSIYDNPFLEVCSINSICNFLSTNPYYVDIHNNSLGCNSIEEVEEECLVKVSNYYTDINFKIYPNPSKNELRIISTNGNRIEQALIYNSLGQAVKKQESVYDKINITGLEQGVYIVELTSQGLKYRFKFVLE